MAKGEEDDHRKHYAGTSIFKIGILLFNLVPLVVLSILG